MPVNYVPDRDESSFLDDTETIGKIATNKKERRQALNEALEKWSSADIGLIEREETATRNGWRMFPYRPNP